MGYKFNCIWNSDCEKRKDVKLECLAELEDDYSNDYSNNYNKLQTNYHYQYNCENNLPTNHENKCHLQQNNYNEQHENNCHKNPCLKERRKDFKLNENKTLKIWGLVKDCNENPLENIKLELTECCCEKNSTINYTKTNCNGYYEFLIPQISKNCTYDVLICEKKTHECNSNNQHQCCSCNTNHQHQSCNCKNHCQQINNVSQINYVSCLTCDYFDDETNKCFFQQAH